VRVALTFVIVVIAWVFFRAPNLGRGAAYLGSMFGLNHASPAADLISGIVYKPYYLISMALAAIIVWLGKQTWDWTQRMTWPKAFACCGLLWTALAVMATQEYNPFIYFIF